MSRKRFTNASCPECNTFFDRLPLEYDEDGLGCAVLEVMPCMHPGCERLLCPCCAKFACDGCGQTFCAIHLASVKDGTPRPLHCCPACALECEEIPAPLPVQSELSLVAASGVEVA